MPIQVAIPFRCAQSKSDGPVRSGSHRGLAGAESPGGPLLQYRTRAVQTYDLHIRFSSHDTTSGYLQSILEFERLHGSMHEGGQRLDHHRHVHLHTLAALPALTTKVALAITGTGMMYYYRSTSGSKK